MKVTITINTENDAFRDDLRGEIDRILTTIPDRVLDAVAGVRRLPGGYRSESRLLDLNGNTVGELVVGPES